MGKGGNPKSPRGQPTGPNGLMDENHQGDKLNVSTNANGKKKVSGVNDFYWIDRMEPHARRKKELIRKYPKEINSLMGYDHKTAWGCVAVIISHILIGAWAIHLSWIPFLVVCFAIGATLSHNLFLAIHEVTHYLAFKSKFNNDVLAMCCNIPIMFPYAMHFKEYHYEHHRYLGWDGIDQDLPLEIEARLLCSTPGKWFWMFFQGVFYALRPTLARPLGWDRMKTLNAIICFSADYIMYKLIGPQIFIYLAFSLLFGTGANPLAGHFISEHYLLGKKKQDAHETHSYYGWANIFSWNVGYHNEHHDFPNVPHSQLYKLTELAPDYYKTLETTTSWPAAQWQFLTDPKVSQWCRALREKGARYRTGPLLPTTSDVKEQGILRSL